MHQQPLLHGIVGGFIVVVVLTLAVGIAVNTAISSVVNGVLLCPLAPRLPRTVLSAASV